MAGPTYEELLKENEALKEQLGNRVEFSLDEYARYGRQMIVPQFGFKGM